MCEQLFNVGTHSLTECTSNSQQVFGGWIIVETGCNTLAAHSDG